VLALIHVVRPALNAGFTYAYASLWFTSSSFLASIGLLRLHLSRPPDPRDRCGAAFAILCRKRLQDLFLVLGERHRRTSPARVSRVTRHSGFLHRHPRRCRHRVEQDHISTRGSPRRIALTILRAVRHTGAQDQQRLLSAALRHPAAARPQCGLCRSESRLTVSLQPLHNYPDAHAMANGVAPLMISLFVPDKGTVLAMDEHEPGGVRESGASGIR
jgi:hypothetical protein